MLPVVILARLLEIWGATLYLNAFFAPLMSLMGLPEWTSLVWVSAILANLYAGLAVLAASHGAESLTVAQMSILCTVILIAHSLPVEARIAQVLGVRLLFILLIRLMTALVLGMILNFCYTTFGLLQQPVQFIWQAAPPQEFDGLFWLVLSELLDLLYLVGIVISLVVLMEVFKQVGVVRYCELLLQPVLRLLSISGQLAHIMAVGCLLGLTYGRRLTHYGIKKK